MKALAVAVAALLSASSAFAGNDQGAELRRPPPPGQSMPQPAPRPQPPSRDGTLVVVDREELNARLARLERLLEEVEDRNYGRGNGRGNGENKLRRALETLDSVQNMVSEAPLLGTVLPPPRPQQPPPPPPPPPAPVVRPMQEGAFKSMNDAIARENFADDKMRVLKMAANNNHFLISQVAHLMTHFKFSDDKLTVVRALRPRILDPENGFQLYSVFSFSSDKKKLEEILAQR